MNDYSIFLLIILFFSATVICFIGIIFNIPNFLVIGIRIMILTVITIGLFSILKEMKRRWEETNYD